MSLTSNVKWVAIAQVAKIVSQLLSVTILARLLAPEDYGLLAIAMVFTNFATLFRDLGTGSAIIQRAELTHSTKNSIFWLNIALGLIILAALSGLAPFVADFYAEPSLVMLLTVLAISFPVNCSSIVHQALLERASEFKTVAGIEGLSVAMALCCAISAALLGCGVYSLVIQAMVVALVQSVLLWRRSGWRPAGRPRLADLKALLGYSGNVSLFQFVNYFARNADSFIIGKVLGSASLGLYNIAYRLMLFPVQNMSYVLARATFPLMAKMRGEHGSIAPIYMQSVSAIAFVTAPIMTSLWLLRDPTISMVFGLKWAGAQALLLWLAPTGFVQSILSTTGSVFQASGKTGAMFRYGLVGAILQVAAFLIGIEQGLAGLVMAYFVATLLNAMLTLPAVLKIAGATIREFLRTLAFPLGASSVAAVLVFWIDGQVLEPRLLADSYRVVAGYSLFGVTYFAAAMIWAPDRLRAMLSLLRHRASHGGRS